MYYEYNVAGIRILCKMTFPLVIQGESEEFLSTIKEENIKNQKYDLHMNFIACEKLPAKESACMQQNCTYYSESKDEWKMYYCSSPDKDPYACTIWKPQERLIECWYLEGEERYLNYSKNITSHIGLETLMRVWSGFILHASLICWNEKGIIFSAPSGTGKSTQAELWRKYENADVLNGDRAGIRKVDGTWKAYGLPYAGTSGIYRNESVVIESVVLLRQAKENKIRKMEMKEAFRFLYPEVTVHRWDKEFVEQIWDILLVFLAEVPVYLLECTPDKKAVETLKKQIILDRV